MSLECPPAQSPALAHPLPHPGVAVLLRGELLAIYLLVGLVAECRAGGGYYPGRMITLLYPATVTEALGGAGTAEKGYPCFRAAPRGDAASPTNGPTVSPGCTQALKSPISIILSEVGVTIGRQKTKGTMRDLRRPGG